MNIMNKLTLRLLKENKRRTMVTIIGVIISVAMLTAVSTIAVSFIDLLKRQEIADSGEWHALYKNVNSEQIEALKNDDSIRDVILSNDIGYAMLEDSANEHKPYVFLKAYDEKGFNNFPIILKDGRFPKSNDEIVISEAIEENGKVAWQIDEEISLETGQRVPFDKALDDTLDQSYSFQTSYEDGAIEEELITETEEKFTIVGVMERPTWEPIWSAGYTTLTYLDTDNLSTSTGVNASVVWNKVSSQQVSNAEKLGVDIGTGKPSFNRGLLRYYGVFGDAMKTTLYSLAAIIMTIIIIGSVSLIYNAFAISVSERSRYLGMLASIGATKEQKRRSVFFEGAVIGAISIPLGLLAGIGGIAITFIFINSMIGDALGLTEKLIVTVTPWSVIVACLVSILTIFISTYIPARRASKITAIDAIRQAKDIKLTNKKIKTNRLIRKLFGIEAEFGLKYLKRNKKRYQITVFSLVISIVLFLSVSYFTFSMKQAVDLTQDGINYDIELFQGNQSDEQWNRLVAGINELEEVTELIVNFHSYYQTKLDGGDIPESARDTAIIEDGKVINSLSIVGLDDGSLEKFNEEADIDIENLYDKNSLNGILINEVEYYSEDGKYVRDKALLKSIGESIDVYDFNQETFETYFVDEINISHITTERPMGVHQANEGQIIFIVSEQTFKQLKSEDSYETTLSLTSTDPIKTGEDINEIREVAIDMFNYYEVRQSDQQIILILSVFTYGFITLITAISIANIFNTISTSISLRKREFAMLKSVGMTPKSFNKMINYESIFYGIKSLLYGLPISIGIMYLMHYTLENSFLFDFTLPWFHIIFVIIAIFLIVGSAMLYSSSKVKKENIIDTLKQENI